MGARLREGLRAAGCDDRGLLGLRDRPTTVKQNFVGLAQHRHPQKMFRVDTEERAPISARATAQLLQRVKQALRGARAVCLEDYNKGVLTEDLCQGVIALAKKRGVPVFVDPAAIRDYAKYRGATCITPNRTEASLATRMNADRGDEPTLRAMAAKLLRELRLESVVLTLDKQGALLQEKTGEPRMVPTVARQVYDVTGAGDMVLAMLAAARANGADWHTAVELANTAAGLEVEKFGIVPIELDEVLLSVLRQQHEQLGKLRTLDQLLPELHAYRQQGRRIAFTNGCFDILHAGHVAYLREARRAGDLLVVGLNSDASIRRLKGDGRPVNHEADRVMVMSELTSVDYIVVFGEDTPIKLIEAIRPDALVKGSDYTRATVVGADIVERHGGKVVLVDLVEGRSTTNIIRKIAGK
jgi:D-beta-D-heptose 7-phosphate kinase/D-beta-D-heptose 1-phosphate adenosyltransferase